MNGRKLPVDDGNVGKSQTVRMSGFSLGFRRSKTLLEYDGILPFKE